MTIQIDVDEHRIGVNKPIEIGLVADASEALRALGDAVAAQEIPNRAERKQRLDGYSREIGKLRAKLDKPAVKAMMSSPVHPGAVPSVAQAVMPDDTVWVLDGGNTVVWANFYLKAVAPRSMISTYKFGMLGAGLGQALGAAIAAPDRRVCCLIGDGAFGMHTAEIETAVRLGLPVVFVVLVDGQWGMVKMSQQIAVAPVEAVARKVLAGSALPEDKIVYADFSDARYDRIAGAFGAHGEYVTAATDLRAALERARDCGGPAVVHVEVDNVEHMWAPGLRAFKKMHEEPEG